MYNKTSGMSLVEIIVGISIMSLVFLTLFASFQGILTFAERNQLRANALLLANEHLELIRALPYDSIGTVAGLPSGNIPQIETIVFDGKQYTRRTLIIYVDDPADGLGAADSLSADYKKIKVEMKYFLRGSEYSFSVVSTIAPKSQESLIGAGILRMNVTDAVNNPIPFANLHVVNYTIATSVDLNILTNASGTVSLPGAWAGSGYEVYVSKAGYSSAQTYTSTTSNPNPSPSPYNVAENATTEIFFKIDLLSDITLFTRAWPVRDTMSDSFFDASLLSIQNNVQVTGGSLVLMGAPGTYAFSGNSASASVSPASLKNWLLFTFEDNVSAGTSLKYQIEYDTGGGTFALIPDSDLPSNSSGYTVSPVDLGTLDTTIYDSLRIITSLATTDQNNTPEVFEYTLSYHESDIPVPNVTFSLTSGKTIGTDALGDPIYKYSTTDQTSGTGLWTASDMEYDVYDLQISGHTLAEACPALPLVLQPNTSLEQVLTITSASTHSLKIQVNGPLGGAIERAEVHIIGGATNTTLSTGPCGIAYFPSLTADVYDVFVRAPGYASTTSSVAVSGATESTVVMSF